MLRNATVEQNHWFRGRASSCCEYGDERSCCIKLGRGGEGAYFLLPGELSAPQEDRSVLLVFMKVKAKTEVVSFRHIISGPTEQV